MITGSMFFHTSVLRVTCRTFLHSEGVADAVPVGVVLRLGFIAALAAIDVAGVALARVRDVVLQVAAEHGVRDDVVGDLALRIAAPGSAQAFLVHDQVGAFRTLMSSNGGCVRFIVMYQVGRPELMW